MHYVIVGPRLLLLLLLLHRLSAPQSNIRSTTKCAINVLLNLQPVTYLRSTGKRLVLNRLDSILVAEGSVLDRVGGQCCHGVRV